MADYSNSLRVVHHEAGHAVAAWALGMELMEIEAWHTRASLQHEKWDALCKRFGKAEASSSLAIVRLAGGFAQIRGQRETYWTGCDPDRADARANASSLAALTGEDPDACFNRLSAETDALVEKHWSRIEALSEALTEIQPRGGTMAGDEVVAIIESVEP